MQVNGTPISDEMLCEVTEYVKTYAEGMDDLPTEFEVVCAIAFEYFKRSGCDIVVLEVGLGGRLDATNVIDAPLVAVVSSIDYDHTQILGETLAEIAAEKSGIIKTGTTVVCYEQQPEAMDVIALRCAECCAPLDCCDFTKLVPGQNSLNGQTFDYKQFTGLKIRLLGAHQLGNAALVLEAVLALRRRGFSIAQAAVRAGLAAAQWPGRFEVLRRKPLVVADGGHNPQGVAAAVAAAKIYMGNRPLTMVVGLLADKDVDKMLAPLNAVATRYIATMPENPRALDAQELGRRLAKFGKPVEVVADVSAACACALTQARQGGAVLALGSLYMMGSIRAFFLRERGTK
jgi:dihydrofolate synthase/folylpolyglutamate synthase